MKKKNIITGLTIASILGAALGITLYKKNKKGKLLPKKEKDNILDWKDVNKKTISGKRK
jgi:gas vesicle protein